MRYRISSFSKLMAWVLLSKYLRINEITYYIPTINLFSLATIESQAIVVYRIGIMEKSDVVKINIAQEASAAELYLNIPLAQVNDHVVRMGVMTEPYFWHFHPDSDETFLVTEGILIIELEDKSVELSPGELFTVPKNLIHRTRPKGTRSVNLTFESTNMTTVRVDPATKGTE